MGSVIPHPPDILPGRRRSGIADPLDRGWVSQAILNGLTIIARDEVTAVHPAPVLW